MSFPGFVGVKPGSDIPAAYHGVVATLSTCNKWRTGRVIRRDFT